MVVAYHLLWTLYGWWLPNDPRGSTSHAIRQDYLKDLGDLHHGRKHLQPAAAEIRAFYGQAAQRLKHELLSFPPEEFSAVAETFGRAIDDCGYTCYALAVMPDHIHLILRKHRDLAETMIEKLQASTRRQLIDRRLRIADQPIWTRGG